MKMRFLKTTVLAMLLALLASSAFADNELGDIDPNADPREVLGELFPTCLYERPPVFPNNVLDVAEAEGFTIFAEAVRVAGMENLLTVEDGFTVLAPTNAAFQALPAGALDDLLANPDQLRQVILHHVIQDKYLASEIPLGSLRTSLGKNVDVTGGPTFDGTATIVIPDNVTPTNGILQGINAVILPPFGDFTTRSRPDAPPQDLTLECQCDLAVITAVQEGRDPTFAGIDIVAAALATSQNSVTYAVQAGDSLGGIALAQYGNAGLWTVIYDANRDKLSDPSLIYPGMELTVPVE